MTPDTTKPKKTYAAGDTITAKLTLAAGHAVPQRAAAYFGSAQPPSPYDPNRAYSFALNAYGISASPAGQPLVLTVTGVIPHHIVGGTYKPNSVSFYIADAQPLTEPNPDPDGDLVITIADDPATPASKPVIQGFDLA